MYALKPSQPRPQPGKPQRPRRKPNVRKRVSSSKAIAYETTAKLVVNVVLSMAAISALVQLLPYRSSQEVKLQELEAAVKSTGDRVQKVQSKFSYYFDPYQARESMQELTDRIDPLRRRIIWKTPVAPAPVRVAAPQPAPASPPAAPQPAADPDDT
jgi:hypothetical protein